MDRQLPLSVVIAAVAGVAFAIGTAKTASATTIIPRTFYQNGGSACTGALPTYEGALRKRPKAIANEGETIAFVTCSAVGNDQNIARPDTIYLYVTNRSGAPVDLSCTLVNGDEFYGSIYTVKTEALPMDVITQVKWLPMPPDVMFPNATVNVSCALPADVEVNIFSHTIDQDVGF